MSNFSAISWREQDTFNEMIMIPLSTIFHLYRAVSWWRKPEDSEKTTDLSQVTDKLYHIIFTDYFLSFIKVYTSHFARKVSSPPSPRLSNSHFATTSAHETRSKIPIFVNIICEFRILSYRQNLNLILTLIISVDSLTPLSTMFQVCRGGQFYWWKKPE
jgi:hypothetical protein